MATAVSVCVCAATLRLECNHGTTILQTTDEVELQGCSALQCQGAYFALFQSVYDTVGGNVHHLDRVSAHVGELPQIAAVGFVSVVPLHLLGVQCGIHCLEGMNDGGIGCLGACGGDDLVGPLQHTHDAVVAISDNQLHQLAHHGLPALFDSVQLSLDFLVGDVGILAVKHVLCLLDVCLPSLVLLFGHVVLANLRTQIQTVATVDILLVLLQHFVDLDVQQLALAQLVQCNREDAPVVVAAGFGNLAALPKCEGLATTVVIYSVLHIGLVDTPVTCVLTDGVNVECLCIRNVFTGPQVALHVAACAELNGVLTFVVSAEEANQDGSLGRCQVSVRQYVILDTVGHVANALALGIQPVATSLFAILTLVVHQVPLGVWC